MKTVEWLNLKTNEVFIHILTVLILVLLQVVVLPYASLWAASPGDESCPLVNSNFKAQLVKEKLTGTVNEEIILSFTLDPPALPRGFFLSVNMKVLQEPESGKFPKPKLLTGFPETSAVFYCPGIYRYSTVVSLIAKAGCGGLKAKTIYNGEVHIKVNP